MSQEITGPQKEPIVECSFLDVGNEEVYRRWPKFQEQQMENDSKVCQLGATQPDVNLVFFWQSPIYLMDGFNRSVDYLKCQEIFLFWIFVYFVIWCQQKSKYCFHCHILYPLFPLTLLGNFH